MEKGNIDDHKTVYKITQELCYLTEEPDDLLDCHCRIVGHGGRQLAELKLVLTDENGKLLDREQVKQHLLEHGADEQSLTDYLDSLFYSDDDLPDGSYVEYMWESISKIWIQPADLCPI